MIKIMYSQSEKTPAQNNLTTDLDPNIINRDVTHIYFEIRQLRNQQFLITTASLTIFGVITGWISTNNLSPEGTQDVGLARFVLCGSLLVTLFVFFYYLRKLQDVIHALSTYLKVRKWSYWEYDYENYTKKPYLYVSQTRTRTYIFLVLGVLSLICCRLSCISLHWDKLAIWSFWITFLFLIIYVVLLVGMGFRGWFSIREEAESRWKLIINHPKNRYIVEGIEKLLEEKGNGGSWHPDILNWQGIPEFELDRDEDFCLPSREEIF